MSLVVGLALLFIGLKLSGAIAWSWFWVLSPFYPGIIIILGFGVVFCLAPFFRKGE